MQTIVLATQKGGSGKSTLAIGLALAAVQAGHTVRLIETDSQGTLSSWQRRRPHAGPVVEPVYAASDLEQRLQSLEHEGVTLTIIDTASGVSAATTSAIRYADLCLIPARPSIADIEATATTLSVARAWNTPFAYVLNQTPIRGQRLSQAADTLDNGMDGLVATPFIVMRNDHQDALSAGLAVNEYAAGGKSAEEISALWRWIDARLGNAPALAATDGPLILEFAESPAVLPDLAALDPEHDSAVFLRERARN